MLTIDIDLLEASDRIARLSDDVILNENEAAVFLRVSVRTLQRMRSPEYVKEGKPLGVPYIQASGKGLRGANQKVSYRLGDLKAWQRANTVSSTVDAAIRKGQLFTTIFDAIEPAPFWNNPKGLQGRVFDSPIEEFLDRIGIVEIVWRTPYEAAIELWADAAAHRIFADKFLSLFNQAELQINSSVERSELSE